MTELFLDTSFTIALSSVTDQNHVWAVKLANQIEADRTCLVTTQAILLEIGNSLSKQKSRAAIQLLESLETDPSVEVILLTNSLYESAFNLFKQREDKEWGLVDCVSFVVRQDRGITDALTTDTHFQQAGFRALLKGSAPYAYHRLGADGTEAVGGSPRLIATAALCRQRSKR